jgi:hypothetical protein
VWLFDTLSDLVIIDKFWNFQIPILYPKNDSALSEITYLSYQTLTIGTRTLQKITEGDETRARNFIRSPRIDSNFQRNQFQPGGPLQKPYSYSVPSSHRLFKNSSTVFLCENNLTDLVENLRVSA